MEQEFNIEQDLNSLEVLKYNARFDSTGMLTIREVYRRLQNKNSIFLSYTDFFKYLIDFGVFEKTKLFGKNTYSVSSKYSELIKQKICKDKISKDYYYIYLLTESGLKYLLSLIIELDIINWEAI